MAKSLIALTVLAGTTLFTSTASSLAADTLGYKDTPLVQGLPWHVHDPDRPRPKVVTSGKSFSQGAPAPSDAVVLFNGTDLSKWKSDKGEAKWKVENGYMEVVTDAGNISTKDEFGDFQLHLEFATPKKVAGNSQERGNSGVFMHGIYELQILDTYDNLTYPDGQCGALYGQWPPLVNACKKPGEWQSYDIIFEAPHWDGNQKLTRPASITVLQNGVVIHNKREYLGKTEHREAVGYQPYSSRGPIKLQDHGNPIRFRNIWIRKLGEYDRP
jgi:hypothetical protein